MSDAKEGQLLLVEGEIIKVPLPWSFAGSPECPQGWIKGTTRKENKEGLFPATHVEYWGEQLEPRSPSPPVPPLSQQLPFFSRSKLPL